MKNGALERIEETPALVLLIWGIKNAINCGKAAKDFA
jgi:hypothetical protein